MSLTFVKKNEALAHMPMDAKRAQVRERDGTIKWKKLEDVLESDAICFKNGRPSTMKGLPGRPSQQAGSVQPDLPSEMGQVIAPEVTRNFNAKKKSVSMNPLYQQICDDPYGDPILSQIMKELAEEAAALKFERKRADQQGRDAIALSVRRVDTLQRISDTWFKRREQLASKSVDLRSQAFRRLWLYILETFMEAMESAGVPEATAGNVQMTLGRKIQEGDWIENAKEAMRGSA